MSPQGMTSSIWCNYCLPCPEKGDAASRRDARGRAPKLRRKPCLDIRRIQQLWQPQRPPGPLNASSHMHTMVEATSRLDRSARLLLARVAELEELVSHGEEGAWVSY